MSRGATARLFAAVDPPAEARTRLHDWARGVASGWGGPALRVLDPGSLHVTLCFLGSRPVAEIDVLAAALGECEETVGELSVGAPLLLPPRRPRSLALEVRDPSGTLAALQAEVARALGAVSTWEPERRRFRAHVTVARMRAELGAELVAGLPPTPPLTFSPSSLGLYRSWLEPTGARYEAVALSELGESG